MAPGYSALGGGTWTMVLVLAIFCRFFVLRVVPVVPTLRTDVTAHLAIHEECLGERTPRTAQIHLLYTFGCSEFALVEHIAVFLTGWA